MKVTFSVVESDGSGLSESKIDDLCESLGINDRDDLQRRLEAVGQASMSEYVDMLAGNGIPTRADEVKQNRLLYLIKRVFSPRLPAEDEISVMFQLTASQARTLLRNTLSRHRIRVKDEINETLNAVFQAAERTDKGWDVEIASEVLVEQFNIIVAQEGGAYEPVRKRPTGTRKYFIAADTYNVLSEYFGS